jgi:phage repressor protein C with HTH and peptisase S24 domain
MKGSDVRRLREEQGWSQKDFADRLKVSTNSIWNWEQNPDKELKLKTRVAIEKLISDVSSDQEAEESGIYLVPLYDVEVSAGSGHFEPSHETIIEKIPFPENWIRTFLRCRPAQLIMIKVSGDSMEPLVREGDRVLVDIYDNVAGDGIYLLNFSGLLRLKQTQVMMASSQLRISSLNERYRDEVYDGEEANGIRVVGRAVWCGRRL